VVTLTHRYAVHTEWTGNLGTGTSGYRAYSRNNTMTIDGKPGIDGSADRAFYGDADRWNPEDFLVASLSECHMLSFLHAATVNRVVVLGYTDDATGVMEQTEDGGGHFVSVTLRPRVMVAEAGMVDLANSLHAEAARKCFIAASVNFPVEHEPVAFVLA
jgi:organic hydroperoxide reductase OsmC/OhrA